jgi:hypothetical protein
MSLFKSNLNAHPQVHYLFTAGDEISANRIAEEELGSKDITVKLTEDPADFERFQQLTAKRTDEL